MLFSTCPGLDIAHLTCTQRGTLDPFYPTAIVSQNRKKVVATQACDILTASALQDPF